MGGFGKVANTYGRSYLGILGFVIFGGLLFEVISRVFF
jgi:hypothetical protein